MLEISTVSTRGQITIPTSIRKKLEINAGDRIIFEESEGCVTIKKPVDFFKMEGCFSLGHLPDDEEELFTPEMGQSMEQE